MSYTKMVKQWKRESDKLWKERSIQFKKDRLQAEKIQTMTVCSNMIKQIKDREALAKNNIVRREIIQSLRLNNPFTYRQFLIIWDLINSDFNQILYDLGRGKINKDDVIMAIGYINKFSNSLIDEYWKNTLINPKD